ncbi:MAG: DUF4019 domain-containing protein [Deltaproteobacteria bacterium]|nr:DUF4019 domain-containing protein [Deltaproteobacteria bacterium]
MFARSVRWMALSLALLSAPALAGEREEAEQAGKTWLSLTDSGKYAESHGAAGKFFRDALTAESWVGQVKAVRGPLGKLVARKLKTATSSKTLPGAPDGDYVVMTFDSSFENKKSAVETVTVVKEPDGKLRVVGYFIR